MRITKNLIRSECACKCGCSLDTADYQLVVGFQKICDEVSKEIHRKCIANIHCLCRCAKHNKEIGGLPTSKHIIGKAMDLDIDGISSDRLYTIAITVLDDYIFDIVKYDWGIHLEVDPH